LIKLLLLVLISTFLSSCNGGVQEKLARSWENDIDDLHIVFNENGTYLAKQYGKAAIDGKWEYVADNNSIIVEKNGNRKTMTIVQITDDTLIINASTEMLHLKPEHK